MTHYPFFSPPWDWLLLLLVLFSPRDIGDREAAVFEVLAEAYSARRGVTLCLSGLDAFCFARSWILVVDNLPERLIERVLLYHTSKESPSFKFVKCDIV
jgi:hypothetical protein